MMQNLYLIGEATSYSLSPAMWNHAFKAAGLAEYWRYTGCPTRQAELPAAITSLRRPGTAGANITMPYKVAALAVADGRNEDADRAGATNWLSRHGGSLYAANTDVAAVRTLLAERGDDARPPWRVVLLGAGGAGRAAVAGLNGFHVADLVILDRCSTAAIGLADRARAWGLPGRVGDWPTLESVVREADLVINSAPFGMTDPSEPSPIPSSWFCGRPMLYDFVYTPVPTALQRTATWAGVTVCDGLAHLESQAVATLPLLDLPESFAPLLRAGLTAAAGRTPCRWS
ncbi:shikimate dehydrogenase [Streptomyces sp. MK37H]|uniref:shikimate dehydrogenase family protein n=1 Tax=Streptomyces sp. MK37H TaxID=2699117 RepID=UPI001B384CEA|nr:hypothetical protein [Streptomyces sp. MK37H]MBP8532275.1 hypothetical protein [Streptomyces sp. MK37H]